MHTSNIDPKQIGYSWVPTGIVTSSKIQKYFDLLPKEKVPKIGSVGERYRIRQLNYQLPKQDIDYAYCKHVGLDRECFEEFVTTRNEIALDVGYIKECGTNTACANCKEQINQNELAVNATKFSNRVIWHPRCFQCCVCNELLVDLTYCAFEEKLFCERHYAEIFKPRCNTCDEGTADKPSRKTSHEKDAYASDTNACELLEKVNHYGSCSLNSVDEKMTEENPDAHDMQTTTEPNRMIKKVDNLPNLNHYFNDALKSEIEEKTHLDADANTPQTPMSVVEPLDLLVAESRDARSLTVYSRSGSESSNIYSKSISRDSSDSNTDIDYLRQRYDRTDSTNSFIQDELDSEEYHHGHRFSMTAEALEYIRGRDDWRDHTQNILNNRYRRQSSNIRIREQIDSDEYHHDRKLSDLIEIAYLDAESIKSLPSSFKDNAFDQYYLELQQINGQLSNDIEQNIAQKQVILLDSTEIEAADGYVYPLPDIILDRASDNGDESYAVEQVDSDYSNLSESEDDIQSVVEVNCGTGYEGEVITTLNMNGDDGEMIEVTLWDLHDDISRERSTESDVEIISIPSENQMLSEQYVEVPLLIGDRSEKVETIGNTREEIASIIKLSTQNIISAETPESSTVEATESSDKIAIKEEDTSRRDVTNSKDARTAAKKSVSFKDQTKISDSKNTNELQDSPSKSSPQTKTEDRLMEAVQVNSNQRPMSTGIEVSKSFIAHESSSTAQASSSPSTAATTKTPKVFAKSKNPEVDALIMEGSMGVWFHN